MGSPMIDVPPYCILMLFGFDPLSLPKIIPGLRGLCRSRPIAITCLAIVILVPIVAVIWIVISFTVMRNMDEIWKVKSTFRYCYYPNIQLGIWKYDGDKCDNEHCVAGIEISC
jgi:hypothetical protein